MKSAQGMFAATTSSQWLTTFWAKQAANCEVVMPTIAKPSKWRPRAIEKMYEMRLSAIFSEEEEAKFLAIIEIKDESKKDPFIKRLRGTVYRFWVVHYNEQRPTVPQRRTKHTRTLKAAVGLYYELESSDSESYNDLKRAASLDPHDPFREPGIILPEIPNFMVDADDRSDEPERLPVSPRLIEFLNDFGNLRMVDAKYGVKRIGRWAIRARKNLGPATRGRPPQRVLDAAAVEIRDAWKDATGSEPTLAFDEQTYGRYLELTRLALARYAGEDAGFETACRRAVYGTNEKA